MGYLRGTSNYLDRIGLYDLTHMMSITNLVSISVEPLRIDNGCTLKKEFIELIHMNPLMVIIPNCQSTLVVSWLCMWSFHLRHRIHLVDR